MKMKKLLIVAVASLIGSAAFAQSGTTSWGLRLGLNLPKYKFENSSETNTTTNFHVTMYLDAPVGSMFSIQPGLSLQGKGGEFFSSSTVEVKQNTMWVEVPVNLVAKFPVAGTDFFLGGGPYAAFGVGGQNKSTNGSTTTTSKVKFGTGSGDNLKSTDFGVNFLGGIRLKGGLNVGAGYGLGLTDLRPNGSGGNGKQTNRVLSFFLGWSM
jgi:hypothetical protein